MKFMLTKSIKNITEAGAIFTYRPATAKEKMGTRLRSRDKRAIHNRSLTI